MNQHELLKKELHYDPVTGHWRWLVDKSRTKAGETAGYWHHSGYRYLIWYGKEYLVSRLAWFYMTKSWPVEIDHINNDPTDNRWCNLRNATRMENMRNQKKQQRVTHKGVSETQRKNKPYRARIHINGVSHHLGYFKSKKLANAAYTAAAKKYFGEFANV